MTPTEYRALPPSERRAAALALGAASLGLAVALAAETAPGTTGCTYELAQELALSIAPRRAGTAWVGLERKR